MKSNKVFFTHASAVSVLFILGNAVISAPRNDADEFTFLGYLTALFFAFLLYFAVLPLAERLFGEKAVTCKRIPLQVLICLIYTAVAILSLWLVADSFLDFVNFVKDVILPRSSITLIIIVFTVVCLFFSSRRQEDILKFFLISFWLALILIVFFFLVTLPNFSLRNIFIFRLPDIKTLYNQTRPYIINPVLPSLLLPVYNVLVFKKSRKGAAFSGLAIGGGLLGLCILSGVLLFGTAFAGELPYPYAAAVSTVTVGRLFTRMDGFSYFIYFAAALCKITVCLFIMYSCLKNIAGVLGGSILQNKKD